MRLTCGLTVSEVKSFSHQITKYSLYTLADDQNRVSARTLRAQKASTTFEMKNRRRAPSERGLQQRRAHPLAAVYTQRVLIPLQSIKLNSDIKKYSSAHIQILHAMHVYTTPACSQKEK
jgi:hypothetical protein